MALVERVERQEVEERGDRDVVQEKDERAMVLLEHSVQLSLIVLKITFSTNDKSGRLDFK